MIDYQAWLLEFIAWKVSGTPLELAEFRGQLEGQYASTCESSPGKIDGRDSGRPEEAVGVQRQGGKDAPAWRERLGITRPKKEA